MTGDWRDFRPAIWLAMLGVAVMLLVAPFYLGAVFVGASVGAAIRIRQRRRRAAAAVGAASPPRRATVGPGPSHRSGATPGPGPSQRGNTTRSRSSRRRRRSR